MRRALLLAGLGLAGGGVSELAAQRARAAPQGPGVVVARYYACGTTNLDNAAGILAGTRGGIAQELIREGLLLDHQVLKRAWGDEWDLIELWMAEDEEAFRYAFEEMGLRLRVTEGAQNRMRTFDTLCPRRKDGQYTVVMPG